MIAQYELKIGEFQGPLEKLLELIEEQKLEISEISLGQVTDGFLAYLEALAAAKEENPEASEFFIGLIADFIVVASRLVYIKSKTLLPGIGMEEEAEAGVRDLEARLRFYRDFKPALKALAVMWRGKPQEGSRPYLFHLGALAASRGGSFFYPGEGADAAALQKALGRLFEIFEKLALERQEVRGSIVTLEEKIKEILVKLQDSANFLGLTEAKSRGEIIVTFLALLHLAREKIIALEQAEKHSDIIITRESADA